jgi:putative transposase
LIQAVLEEVLETDIDEALRAGKHKRSSDRLGYRSGYYRRGLVTRVGKLELRAPQDRQGHFSTVVFERYQRSEKALVAALVEMYIQGVSTRKVKAIAEELCGHEFGADGISQINKKLDGDLQRWAQRQLDEDCPSLIVDARYAKVCEDGVIRSRAVLIALGINWEGRRQALVVGLAQRESANSWKEFLLALKAHGLEGVVLAVSDDHPGLKQALAEMLPEAHWQRCYVHFLRNALDYLPRKADDCLLELRWLYDRRGLEEASRDLAAWLKRWQERHPKLCAWVETNIEETFTFYRLPPTHHKHCSPSAKVGHG